MTTTEVSLGVIHQNSPESCQLNLTDSATDCLQANMPTPRLFAVRLVQHSALRTHSQQRVERVSSAGKNFLLLQLTERQPVAGPRFTGLTTMKIVSLFC
jgi:hypothetical protein